MYEHRYIELPAFVPDEEGAVTVDWVVLSAAVIGMGMLFLSPIAFGTSSVADFLSDRVAAVEVGN